MEKLYIVIKRKKRPVVDCGSDHELLIAKFRLKLKKVAKTTRPSSYDLNQIPYDYVLEVRNRFKGVDLIECLMNYGRRFMILYRRQGSKPSPSKRKAKKAKWLSDEALQIAEKRREAKSKGEKEGYTHLNAELQRIARRDKKAFLSDQCKEIEENSQYRWQFFPLWYISKQTNWASYLHSCLCFSPESIISYNHKDIAKTHLSEEILLIFCCHT